MSQKLRNYFHLVVKAQEKVLETEYVPPELILTYREILHVGMRLEASNWDIDVTALKVKLGCLTAPPSHRERGYLTLKEEMKLDHILTQASKKNAIKPKEEKEAIEKVIELMDRTKDLYFDYQYYLPCFKSAYKTWIDNNHLEI